MTQVLGPGSSKIFAHRAAALDAPENTLSAIRLAKENNAFGVELDLSFTKDGVAIAFHDDDLDRTTNGRGPLDDHTWEHVRWNSSFELSLIFFSMKFLRWLANSSIFNQPW